MHRRKKTGGGVRYPTPYPSSPSSPSLNALQPIRSEQSREHSS